MLMIKRQSDRWLLFYCHRIGFLCDRMKLLCFLVIGILPHCFALLNGPIVLTGTLSLIPSVLPTANPASGHVDRTKQSKHIHDFFKLFGWLNRDDTLSAVDMPPAIRKVQSILRTPETGIYDDRMEAILSKPRCGTVPQYNESGVRLSDGDLHKRYVLWGAKWHKYTITYRFLNFTADISTNRQWALVKSVSPDRNAFYLSVVRWCLYEQYYCSIYRTSC
jgi:hypothetical protein